MKTIFFDMDGLLFDTERLGVDISIALAKEKGIDLTEELFLQVIGTDEKTSEEMLRHLFRDDYTYWDLYEQRKVETLAYLENNPVPIKKGAVELLEYLEQQRIPRGLVTSSYLEMAELFLHRTGLRKYFSTLTSGSHVEKSKPDPEIYLLAAREMGVDPGEGIAIEDSHNGLIAAKNAGMKTIMVPDLKPYHQELAPYVDNCFASLDEVIGFFKKQSR